MVFAFRVSRTFPVRLLGLVEATIMGVDDAVEYSDVDVGRGSSSVGFPEIHVNGSNS